MEEIQEQHEATLPTKRKLDASPEEDDEKENKSLKLDTLSTPINHNNHNHNIGSPIGTEHNLDAHKQDGKNFVQEEEKEEDEDEDEDEEDGDYEEGEDEAEEEAGEKVVVDRKGKGILIEENPARDDDDDDDEELDDLSSDDDDDDDGSGEEADSEPEEDPLAEVDLDNILPSRTRSRRAPSRPGIHIADDIGRSNDHPAD